MLKGGFTPSERAWPALADNLLRRILGNGVRMLA